MQNIIIRSCIFTHAHVFSSLLEQLLPTYCAKNYMISELVSCKETAAAAVAVVISMRSTQQPLQSQPTQHRLSTKIPERSNEWSGRLSMMKACNFWNGWWIYQCRKSWERAVRGHRYWRWEWGTWISRRSYSEYQLSYIARQIGSRFNSCSTVWLSVIIDTVRNTNTKLTDKFVGETKKLFQKEHVARPNLSLVQFNSWTHSELTQNNFWSWCAT